MTQYFKRLIKKQQDNDEEKRSLSPNLFIFIPKILKTLIFYLENYANNSRENII